MQKESGSHRPKKDLKVGPKYVSPVSGVKGEVPELAEVGQSSFPPALRGWVKPHSAMNIPFLRMKHSPLPVLKE